MLKKIEKTYIKKVIGTSFIGIFILIILVTIFWATTIVPAGTRAVVTKFGAVEDKILGEGIHLIIPWVEKATVIDVKEQKEQVEADSASKDLQSVSSTECDNAIEAKQTAEQNALKAKNDLHRIKRLWIMLR